MTYHMDFDITETLKLIETVIVIGMKHTLSCAHLYYTQDFSMPGIGCLITLPAIGKFISFPTKILTIVLCIFTILV